MLFLDILAGKQSKAKVLKAINYIGDDPIKFSQFVKEFMNADTRNSQKLAWVIGKIVDTQPQIITKHIPEFVKKLHNPCHAAVKRNVLRAISIAGFPKDQIGYLADLAFKLLDDPSETVAVRVFSMSILHNVCILEPD